MFFLEIFIRDRHNGGVLPLAGMYLISGYFFDESADQFKKEYLYYLLIASFESDNVPFGQQNLISYHFITLRISLTLESYNL